FRYYQKLIQLRKENKVIQEGTFRQLLEDHTSVFAFQRTLGTEDVVVLANFYGNEAEITLDLTGYEMALSNIGRTDSDITVLKPYEAAVLIRR
ncbi:MAG TPA: hypothetical protein DHW39_11665, partial [Erysipelotrichaceae bacterium]|nr:hypothetical protein [Erysipelotrichaceae bacterium]